MLKLLSIVGFSLIAFSASAQDGEAIFTASCAACHLNPNPQDNAHAPSKADMSKFTPNVVYAALTDGMMRLQGATLSDADRRAVASYLTGKQVTDIALEQKTNMCPGNPPLTAPSATALWNGWGPDTSNSRYAAKGGITAADLPKLKLKWAYGLPGESQTRGQPAVVAGRLYVGNRAGALYSVDAVSGCT